MHSCPKGPGEGAAQRHPPDQSLCSSMKVIASLTVGDLLGGVIGDLDFELFLEGHHQLNDIEAVRAQIVDEARASPR